MAKPRNCVNCKRRPISGRHQDKYYLRYLCDQCLKNFARESPAIKKLKSNPRKNWSEGHQRLTKDEKAYQNIEVKPYLHRLSDESFAHTIPFERLPDSLSRPTVEEASECNLTSSNLEQQSTTQREIIIWQKAPTLTKEQASKWEVFSTLSPVIGFLMRTLRAMLGLKPKRKN